MSFFFYHFLPNDSHLLKKVRPIQRDIPAIKMNTHITV